jgi:uncharacterized protein (DUF433 family)
MLTLGKSVSAAEVAFLAGRTDREINRLVDEDVLPSALILREHGRHFAPLTAPFATFYFDASEALTRAARIQVIATLMDRLRNRPDFDLFLTLSDQLKTADFDWSVTLASVTVLLTTFVQEAWTRVARMNAAASHIVEDPEILGGTPCFFGTRVPIANVVGAAEEGMSFSELKSAYPFLSLNLMEDAAVYIKARPRAGRPRRIAQVNPELTLVQRKVVRPGREDT